MGGGHGSLDDAELLVQHLHEGGQAVGGARSVADDLVLMLVVVGVHSYHVSGDGALPRSGDEHLLGSGLQVLAGTSLVDEYPGALDDKVDVQVPA